MLDAEKRFNKGKEMTNCPLCKTNEWKNVDEYRYKEEGMHLCLNCGFITYPDKLDESKVKKHYEKDYRTAPTINNFYTGIRKVHYHHAFLKDVIAKWIDKNQSPSIYEVGAAYGVTLNWFKDILPQATVGGTELTTSYIRNAWHEYGIKLTTDIDMTQQHDLIVCYKVLEHVIDPIDKLQKFKQILKKDGLLYISVPTWFDRLTNFGTGGFDIEYYYHPDHINVWTKKQFESILEHAGFEIIKSNLITYGASYLCKKKDDNTEKTMIHHEPIKFIQESLGRVKESAKLFESREFTKAIEVWPDFPLAHIHRYELNRKQFHELGWDYIKNEVITPALNCCRDSVEILTLMIDIYMRYGKWEDSINLCKKGLEWKANGEKFLLNMALCYKELALDQPNNALEYFKQGTEILSHLRQASPASLSEATTWGYNFQSNIPTPWEGKHE